MTKALRPILLFAAAAALLSVPWIAMFFTSEVNWDAFDFLVAGVLLFGSAAAIEMALRLLRSAKLRVAACAAILVVLALVWAELAVGVFGTPFAGS
jgi:hypothetical protein